jgi:hypothetical protein
MEMGLAGFPASTMKKSYVVLLQDKNGIIKDKIKKNLLSLTLIV